MTPNWLNDTVRAFGRQMGLKDLSLNERGSAGVAFEDGRELRLEFDGSSLAILVTVATAGDLESVKRVLTAAHPDARRGVKVRSGLFEREGKAFFHARLAEREVAVDALERVFRELWAASSAGRAA